MEQLKRKSIPLLSDVKVDKFTEMASKAFDYEFDGTTLFYPYEKPELEEFEIGLIVGASGSGKSQLLEEFGRYYTPMWTGNEAIVSHFSTPEEAIDKLSSVGLNSIPSWCKPYYALSTGERYRADLARLIKQGACIDEFTSVVDRNVAKATATSVAKYIRRNGLKNVVFASCHYDIIEWLEPSWIIDTNVGTLTRGSQRRPDIQLDIYRTGYKSWRIFAPYHYLTEKINKSARCYLAFWGDNLVGFASAISFPNGYIKNGWRGHRTVVLPDFQGLGIGAKLSDAVAQMFIEEGCRYFSRTAHFRLGEYRQNSPKWKPTSKNKVLRKDIARNKGVKDAWRAWDGDGKRVCYSHEYVGD